MHELLAQNQDLRATLRQFREEQRVAEETKTTASDSRVERGQGAVDMVPAAEMEEARVREAKLKV